MSMRAGRLLILLFIALSVIAGRAEGQAHSRSPHCGTTRHRKP